MANLDVTTLQLLRSREEYNKYNRRIPKGLLDVMTVALLKDYGRYYNDHPEHNWIDPDAFRSVFYGTYHPTLSDEQRAHYNGVLNACLKSSPDDAVRKNYINNLIEQETATKIAELLTEYNDGADINYIYELNRLLESADQELEKGEGTKFFDDDIGELLKVTQDLQGIEWRLLALRNHMRPMVGGDFGIIAGRPDTGKTSFIASEITHMAPQIPKTFGTDRPIIWFNNEGMGKRIKPRVYQAALDMTLTDMVKANTEGTLINSYKIAVDDIDRIRIVDVHGWWNYQVEEVIKQYRPAIVIYDMIDNIKFADGNSGARTDQVLEGMYQWARELCVKYDCIGIGTSQISTEGDDMLFPAMSMLKDSKTGKQGAVDFQIMIGRSNTHNTETVRGISIPKNKLRREGVQGDPRAEVIFDGNKARFRDALN